MDTPLRIETSDDFELAAHLFEPESPRGAVVLHGGFAIPQRFYRRFAESLARAGYVVLTYDYRGIGESRTGSLRGFHATATQWGRLDWGAATRFLKARHPALPLLAVCHSFGGQALGLAPEAAWYDGIVTIGSQLAAKQHYRGRNGIWMRASMYLWLPLIAYAFGYIPGWTGLGEDAPKAASLEWARWCRSPGYLVDHVPDAAERFAAVRARMHMIAVADDHFAPVSSVRALAERLTGASKTVRVVHPEDLGMEAIGHFAPFRPTFADTLWVEIADTLDEFAGETRALAAK